MKKAVVEKKRRFKPEVRKAQIIEATKQLIFENGLSWASSLRIAKALGISQSALYHPFKNRHEILVETLSSIINEIVQMTVGTLPIGFTDNQVRDGVRAFYEKTVGDPRQARVLFEFFCAPSTENMLDETQAIFAGWINKLEETVGRGIDEGAFRADIDVTAIAWMIASFGLGIQMGVKLGMQKFVSVEQSMIGIDIILQAIKK